MFYQRFSRLGLQAAFAIFLAILLVSFLPTTAEAERSTRSKVEKAGEIRVAARQRKRKYRRSKIRRNRKKRKSRAVVSGIWRPEVAPKGPVQLVISLLNQRVDVYRDGVHVARSRISTGRSGYRTPRGIFSIIEKNRVHFSNIYNNAPMPNMQRITWSGIALHGGPVPNYPASHGCIRLPYRFARKLFGLTELGAHVIITDGTVAPLEFSHPNLFQPTPFSEILAARNKAGAASGSTDEAESDGAAIARAALQMGDAEAALVRTERYRMRSDKPLRILITRRGKRDRVRDVQRILGNLGYDAGPVDGAVGKLTIAAIGAFQGALGRQRSGVVSDQLVRELYRITGRSKITTGQLYVRQGFKDVFETPVVIADPDVALGTHIFTAMQFAKEAREARWTMVTAQKTARKKFAQLVTTASRPKIPLGAATAADALDRIVIPDRVRRRISEMLTPGSSLVITDNGISGETGEGTDFIVKTR